MKAPAPAIDWRRAAATMAHGEEAHSGLCEGTGAEQIRQMEKHMDARVGRMSVDQN